MKAGQAKQTSSDATGEKTTGKTDAISLLKADHRKVEQIFAQFEQTEDDKEKEKLARQACLELIVHTKLEEELFYSACREKNVKSELLDEAQVEHDSAKILIADILQCSADEEFYDAKVKTLSEYIRHHVAEEEKPRSGIFAEARKAQLDLAGLGQKIQTRKMELMARSEALTSRPPQPRSIHIQPQETMMARYDRERDERGRFTDDDDRRGGGRGGSRERDSYGRFASDDDNRGRSSRSGSGWHGDPEGHSRASREGWDERGSSRSRYDDDDDRRYVSRGERGRGQGGWFGDPEGHSEASREGWRHSSHEGSGWYGDPEGHSQASREGWRHSSHEGSGWYGDPEGHSEASREGWEDRGRSGGRRSSRGRDDDDDRRGRGGRGHGGWFGDSEGHSRASREGWDDRR